MDAPAMDAARRLAEANRLANQALAEIQAVPNPDRSFLEDRLREYVARKMALEEGEISDSVTEMIQISVARSMHVDISRLKKVDHASKCNGTTAVISKRVLLFLAIQKGLGVTLPPEKTPDIHTVQDLADILLPLLRARAEG